MPARLSLKSPSVTAHVRDIRGPRVCKFPRPQGRPPDDPALIGKKEYRLWRRRRLTFCLARWGGGPRVVVSTAAFHARVRGSVPGLGGLKETKLFLPHPRVKVSIVGSLRDREVACSASDRQGSNFESCVWRTVSSQSSHHPQEVLLAQFSLYVHKGGLKPDSFFCLAR